MKLNVKQRGIGRVLFLVFLLSACDRQPPDKQKLAFDVAGQTMGTSYRIKASSLPGGVDPEQLKSDIDALLESINDQMSTYRPNSELSRFNSQQSDEWQSVSEDLFEVLQESKKISDLTQGAFDISVGPLVNLWGFGPDPINFKVPPDQIIQEQLNRIGYRHLQLRAEPLAIRKAIPDLYLDLSAIAKGYGVDRVGLLLENRGINDYLVEIGGELRLRGSKSDGSPWRIAIEKPASDQRMIQKIVPVSDIAIATSGDYRNFFVQDGVRFSHTIDPRTGRPIDHNLASVTVISDTAMAADAWATAFMVLGSEEGLHLAEQKRIAVLFIVKTDRGFDEISTTAFSEFFEERQ